MKKRFVLVLALILLVASASLFADPTHVTVSGQFRAGYNFTFADGSDPVITAWSKGQSTAKKSAWVAKIAIKGDFYSITLGDPTFNGSSNGASSWATGASATISLDKIAKANGSDWKDITASLTIGSDNGAMSAPSVYLDPNGSFGGDYSHKLRMIGSYSFALNIGYGKMFSFYLAGAPSLWATGTSSNNKTALLANVTVAPVDGVSLTAGWTGDAQQKFTTAAGVEYKKGAIGGSVLVDVKKLAGLDFDLKVSAQDNYYFKNEDVSQDAANYLLASVYGGMDSWDVYAEYQLLESIHNVVAEFDYNGIKNVALDAWMEIDALNDSDNRSVYVGADASYKVAPATFMLGASYAVTDKSFALKPGVKIDF